MERPKNELVACFLLTTSGALAALASLILGLIAVGITLVGIVAFVMAAKAIPPETALSLGSMAGAYFILLIIRRVNRPSPMPPDPP